MSWVPEEQTLLPFDWNSDPERLLWTEEELGFAACPGPVLPPQTKTCPGHSNKHVACGTDVFVRQARAGGLGGGRDSATTRDAKCSGGEEPC